MSTSPCENLMMSSTPKNSVKPTATSAYIMPSISPFMTYCANRPRSMSLGLGNESGAARRAAPQGLLLARQLALARGVFAVVPLHELAVLHHVLRDHGDRVLAVIVDRDLADDGIAVLHVAEVGDDLL